MIAAIAAPTVNTTQNNTMIWNDIMAFTAASFPARGAGGRGLTGYAVGSASLWLRRGRWRCHLRIVSGRQTGSRPILRSAAGICPRVT
jgi:hypothetical protein